MEPIGVCLWPHHAIEAQVCQVSSQLYDLATDHTKLMSVVTVKLSPVQNSRLERPCAKEPTRPLTSNTQTLPVTENTYGLRKDIEKP